ncbi:MAG: serine protease [Pseudomonadota bacterium]
MIGEQLFPTRLVFAVVAGLTVLLRPVVAQPFEPQRLYDTVRDSVVKLEVSGTDAFSSPVKEEGSGFVVFSNERLSVIATAAHVIGPKSNWSLDEAGDPRTVIRVLRETDTGTQVIAEEATILGNQAEQPPESDWIFVAINAKNLPALPLQPQIPIELGTDVLLVGYARGSVATKPLPGRAQAFDVSAYRVRQPFVFDGGHPDKGMSGGPIVNADGNVVAIASHNHQGAQAVHLGVFSSIFQADVQALGGNGTASQIEIDRCVSSKLDGQLTRVFSQSGSVRCPGGGCVFQSGSCNRRETLLSYAAPDGYVIDDYRFIQEGKSAAVTGNLRPTLDGNDRVRQISISLICDPSDFPGAPGGWNSGRLEGTLRFANLDALRRRAEQECSVELGAQ